MKKIGGIPAIPQGFEEYDGPDIKISDECKEALKKIDRAKMKARQYSRYIYWC